MFCWRNCNASALLYVYYIIIARIRENGMFFRGRGMRKFVRFYRSVCILCFFGMNVEASVVQCGCNNCNKCNKLRMEKISGKIPKKNAGFFP